MPETATIILPLPPRVLSPNCPAGSHGGRFARAAASKRYKRLACEATEALGIATGPWEQATIRATFYHSISRRRDDVNHLAMLKPAYDGIVAAGLLVDDDSVHLTTLPATFETDKGSPRVELTIERLK